MHLFNASSLFNEDTAKEFLNIANNPEKLRKKLIEFKEALLKIYNFKAYNLPDDFTYNSYIIASNHLTDSDAPLIISFYYELMHQVTEVYPQLFVFAKENCFNGVSIPKELVPVLELEKIVAVDRNSFAGSMSAMRSAVKWFNEGKKPKHFLIFAQGTIFDINKDKAEDIEYGAFWLARLLGIPVLPAFIEQVVEGEENRLNFGKPFFINRECRTFDEFKSLWLERVISAQNELAVIAGTPAREAVLDDAHKLRKRFNGNKV